jgi:hypothetical protein
MILKVLSFNPTLDHYRCVDALGQEHFVMLLEEKEMHDYVTVCGGALGVFEDYNLLIGKTIECEYLYPYQELARSPVVLED